MKTQYTVEQAQDIYRQAWNSFQLTKNPRISDAAQDAMDSVQAQCTASGKPDQEWRSFAQSLPNFIEFWAEILGEVAAL